MKKSLTYKKSGVDIHKADVFTGAIKQLNRTAANPRVLNKISGFGSLFGLGKNQYKDPVLVSSTDGVGTKLLIANAIGKHDTVGIDLVAMNVNDILCCGARPLFFLDYIACGKIHLSVLKNVVRGIVKGCEEAGCSLIGGETAEMPGMYKSDDYDLAGFAVGIVDKQKIIDGSKIKAGDPIIGLASNGLHSNGFSLVRKVLSKQEIKRYSRELLRPTKIYVKPVLKLLQQYPVRGIAHITGGAFTHKLTKIIPKSKGCTIYKNSWPVPSIFRFIQRKGKISDGEMYATFNMGIGMAVVVAEKYVAPVRNSLSKQGIRNWRIGEITSHPRQRIIQ